MKEHKCLRVGCSNITSNPKYCSSSCSQMQNNIGVTRNGSRNENHCLSCGKSLIGKPKAAKYCSLSCQIDYRKQQVKDKIEAGDTTLSTYTYRKYLVETQGPICSKCGWSEINPTSGTVPIVMDHIDGDSDNNSLDNLRLLCPNCDSLTPTYKSLNMGNGRDSKRQTYRKQRYNKTGTVL